MYLLYTTLPFSIHFILVRFHKEIEDLHKFEDLNRSAYLLKNDINVLWYIVHAKVLCVNYYKGIYNYFKVIIKKNLFAIVLPTNKKSHLPGTFLAHYL